VGVVGMTVFPHRYCTQTVDISSVRWLIQNARGQCS
jgi:hypothetical protein